MARWHAYAHMLACLTTPAGPSRVIKVLSSSCSQAYTGLGDLDMAKRHYGEALRHDPDHAAAKAAFTAAKRLAKLKSQVSSSHLTSDIPFLRSLTSVQSPAPQGLLVC